MLPWLLVMFYHNNVCAYIILSVVSVGTMPMDVENVLGNACICVHIGKTLVLGSGPDNVHFLWE